MCVGGWIKERQGVADSGGEGLCLARVIAQKEAKEVKAHLSSVADFVLRKSAAYTKRKLEDQAVILHYATACLTDLSPLLTFRGIRIGLVQTISW